MKNLHIRINGFDKPTDFVKTWSDCYSYKNEDRYLNHIQNVLNDRNSFIELFKWKNGTGDKIYFKKMERVLSFWEKVDILKQLKSEFSWELFENEFSPLNESTIWKFFLLHLVNPNEFPIFDQHVNRFYQFLKSGKIKEFPSNKKLIYPLYREYLTWVTQMKFENNLSLKKMDESFFEYGKMLKNISNLPIEVCNND